jgi:hypothetical protein
LRGLLPVFAVAFVAPKVYQLHTAAIDRVVGTHGVTAVTLASKYLKQVEASVCAPGSPVVMALLLP